jgi:uncharacterized protein (TIGR02996 family)
MTHSPELLQSLLADPNDDLPRLVLADWLDDNDQPARAEFIRVQCELAELVVCGNPPGYCDCRTCRQLAPLQDRQRTLWHHAGPHAVCPGVPPELTAVLPGSALLPPAAAVVRRGFVAEVRLPFAAFAGGICRRCQGGGNVHRTHDDGRLSNPGCPACGGEGRVRSVAPALFARHPVVWVELTDVAPFYEYHDETPNLRGTERRRVWRWESEVWSVIPGAYGEFASEEEARRVLAAEAAVDWGRAHAAGVTHAVACDRCRPDTPVARFGREGEPSRRVACSACRSTGRIARPGLPPLPRS